MQQDVRGAETPEALARFAEARLEEGSADEAKALAGAILTRWPSHPHALQVRGLAERALGHLQNALTLFERATAEQPWIGAHHTNLGLVLLEMGGAQSALASYQRALAIDPSDAAARFGLGNALVELGSYEEAIAAFDRAALTCPELAGAHSNCALLLKGLGRNSEAIECYRRFVALRPHAVEAYVDLGILLRGQRRLAEAIAALRAGLKARSSYGPCRMELMLTLRAAADWDAAEPLLQELLASESADDLDGWVRPFDELALPLSPERLAADAARFAQRASRKAAPGPALTGCAAAGKRLRVGYLSADFREHPLSHLMQGLFARHDRSAVEIFAYSLGPDDRSECRARIARDAEHFVDLSRHDDGAAVRRIRDDGVDVLVDLMGFTALNRFQILARRAAPVQASYMGFPGSLGAECIDFQIADRVVVPPSLAASYSERLVYLPDTYMVTDDTQAVDTRRLTPAEVGLPEQGTVFCCFNGIHKIEPEVFSAWMRILTAVEGSTLWLLADDDLVRRNLRTQASARGVEPTRLIFAERLPKARHLARLAHADLVLDTFYYGAHTTAVDALWVGVPVLTCPGETFASRVGASLMTAMRMPELIAGCRADYEHRAIDLGRAPHVLRELKQSVAQHRDHAPLFDTRRFARHMEAAFQLMWRAHRTGDRARTIDVPAVTRGARALGEDHLRSAAGR